MCVIKSRGPGDKLMRRGRKAHAQYETLCSANKARIRLLRAFNGRHFETRDLATVKNGRSEFHVLRVERLKTTGSGKRMCAAGIQALDGRSTQLPVLRLGLGCGVVSEHLGPRDACGHVREDVIVYTVYEHIPHDEAEFVAAMEAMTLGHIPQGPGPDSDPLSDDECPANNAAMPMNKDADDRDALGVPEPEVAHSNVDVSAGGGNVRGGGRGRGRGRARGVSGARGWISMRPNLLRDLFRVAGSCQRIGSLIVMKKP
ncbi:hypothetical protein B0H14DRAFT_2563230 [Mycena olivaceomarginata]|nr:hypothetical protein B0H14DRAFT_2563230 [Mycena olivaceomarginata]